MLVSSSSSLSRKESLIPVPTNGYNESSKRNARFPFHRTSSSTSEEPDSNSDSVPSLFEAAHLPAKGNHDSQLAFTSEELQLSNRGSARNSGGTGSGNVAVVGHQHPIVPSPTPGSMKPNKKKFVRHGLMRASTSDLLDSINKRQEVSQLLLGPNNDPSSKNLLDSSNMDLQAGTPGLQPRARPTVTTILRQQHVLEKAEKKERDKLESLMVSNAAIFEVDNTVKELEKKEAEEAKTAESKRLLQTKLAYEKAIAASRKVADEKQKIAESTRKKEKEWQSILEKQREAEKERRKAMAEALQKANYDSKRAFDEMQRSKQLKANKVKQETEQLQAEARLKRQQDELRRQDKIQQIQAAKLALRRTKETMGNPNQFYRSIAIPETQIKLRLQKEEEKKKLQETRQKILAAKQMKSVKLIRAMKKIQSFESLARQQQQQQQLQQQPVSVFSGNKLNNRPFTFPSKVSYSYLKSPDNINKNTKSINGINKTNEEIDKMLEQLKQLRTENYERRVNEKLQRTQATASSRVSSVKIITPNVNKNNDPPKSANNFYRHRSHYGIHL